DCPRRVMSLHADLLVVCHRCRPDVVAQSHASEESTTASACFPRTYVQSVMPRMPFSCSAGTFIGPGESAAPGAGCGNAVEAAVWDVTFPSTFCMVWWMCPLSTVTDPNFLRSDSACALSSVPQPHCGYTLQSGMCANTTIGLMCFKCLTQSFIQASCSAPSVPRPPAFRFSTFTRPMKWTPFVSKLDQPAPLVFLP